MSQDAEVRKFTGHERDMLSGNVTSGDSFDYMHARYYAPLNGRFLSPDPIEGDPGSPQSWNRYTYVLDDPVVFIDPTGLLQSRTTRVLNEDAPCPPESCVIVTATDPLRELVVREMLREFARFLALGKSRHQSLESLADRYVGTLRRMRRADFDYLSISMTIGLPGTYGLLGVGGVVSFDKFGRVYYPRIPSVSVGRSVTGVSGSVTLGTLLQSQSTTRGQLEAYLTGHTLTYSPGAFLGSGFTFSPFSGSRNSSLGAELGLLSPQLGLTYSFEGGPLP